MWKRRTEATKLLRLSDIFTLQRERESHTQSTAIQDRSILNHLFPVTTRHDLQSPEEDSQRLAQHNECLM